MIDGPYPGDEGRKVIYQTAVDREEGVITSWNNHCVFVRYGSKVTSEATDRDDLHWVMPVHTRPNPESTTR